ncbi:hypothetical protein OESDEN_18154 [Oesophagostomum dentatum]|uniref:Uncharacterized protein n=1 Tax=Oesophagostomum dentatum TaxID=61180 RepID=A0A0B1SB90_OESDE|nr:hypothetical protein OESDEN_18154 [Oesophagostomum dentatum]
MSSSYHSQDVSFNTSGLRYGLEPQDLPTTSVALEHDSTDCPSHCDNFNILSSPRVTQLHHRTDLCNIPAFEKEQPHLERSANSNEAFSQYTQSEYRSSNNNLDNLTPDYVASTEAANNVSPLGWDDTFSDMFSFEDLSQTPFMDLAKLDDIPF